MNPAHVRTNPLAEAIARVCAEGPRIPTATYRLQMGRQFTFRDALAVVPYLNDLGISDVYLSPILKARPDSTHGYDVCDHSQLNPTLGSEEDFAALAAELQRYDMGLILDVVPNHMAINHPSNTWWMDVLENGPASVYATYFDINWGPVNLQLRNKVLLPILEDQYGKVLENGRFRIAYEDGSFSLWYWDTRLPIAPESYGAILAHQLVQVTGELGQDHEQILELQSILTALGHLPGYAEELTPERIAERSREKEVAKRRIAALVAASPVIADAVAATLADFNGTVGDPASFNQLDVLLDQQAYRLAFWRVAGEEITYRRFFDINDMAAIRVEFPDVFAASHAVVLRLLGEKKATGVRVDHPDGLWDPKAYLEQLQQSFLLARARAELAAMQPGSAVTDAELAEAMAPCLAALPALHQGSQDTRWPLYVVAEKILSEGEPLPDNWAAYGTTGYDFLNLVNGLFVDPANRRAFDRIYGQFTRLRLSFHDLANSTKKMIMLISLASEINTLSNLLDRISESNRWYRDFTLNSLTFAIREIIACLPVYRTYLTGAHADPSRRDAENVEAAVAEAKRRNPRTAESIFDFIRDTLLLRNVADFPEADRPSLVEFVMKFQQVTGPIMAKGVEDTAFYVHNRLTSLNEVGGNPAQFGTSVGEFHRSNAERIRDWPHAMLATSTHDTKRSEDVRARINVLSEIPDEWRAALRRWGRMNAPLKQRVDGAPAPDANDEYLLYQTLLGAWPEGATPDVVPNGFTERIANYMLKATKEAKVHTSWVNPNESYDNAVRDFVVRVLARDTAPGFLEDFHLLARRVAQIGHWNALAQQTLKLTAPGMPDIYQGTELWDLSLVDPDNRRPVEFDRRQRMLQALKRKEGAPNVDLVALGDELVGCAGDGRIKLYLTQRALGFRRTHADLFGRGRYIRIAVRGAQRHHAIAFARMAAAEAVLVVVPRLVASLMGQRGGAPLGTDVWTTTELVLPRGQESWRYRNVLTDELLDVGAACEASSLPLATIFGHFPVAILERVAR
jgi:(1->4)-alpha-D-glucan 1-alpha-D-glucosylmutase